MRVCSITLRCGQVVVKRPSPAVVFVIVAAAAVPFLDLGGGAPGAATSAVGVATTSTSISAGSGASSLPTASTVAPAIVTIVGTINRLLPDGEVVMNDGQTDYTVGVSNRAMSTGCRVSTDWNAPSTTVSATKPSHADGPTAACSCNESSHTASSIL